MSFLFRDYGPQLNRIEDAAEKVEDAAQRIESVVRTIDRRTIRMSQQESDLNAALQGFFASINAGLDRIEAKLAELAPAVDLTDEIAAIRAAQDAFTARVDVDVAPPETPPA